MDADVKFLDCPGYLDKQCQVRCGLPAEVLCRYNAESTDGPRESAKIICPRGHWFNGPIESLRWCKYPNIAIRDTKCVHNHDVAPVPADRGVPSSS
jgi:hypothetical protein